MPKKDSATVTVTAPLPVRLRMASLEKVSPQRAAVVAEKLWYKVPAPSSPGRLQRFTPAGGEPFFLMSGQSEVQGASYGPVDGPVALLVHGWGGYWQQLASHIPALVEAGYRVVAYDAPSHGRSTHGAHGFGSGSVLEMTEAIDAVVGEFGRPSLVLAHSIGAMAALRDARRRPMAEAYIFFAPQIRLEPALTWFEQVVGMGPRTRELFLERVTSNAGVVPDDFDMVADVTRRAEKGPLPKLLVVHDEQDPDAPFSQARVLADAWPSAELMATQGLGHRKVIWHKEVVKKVADFIQPTH
ncbi:alpha/beta hydrolase [Luteococcus japonicus]|uniref:AB hydrolase-1 domain-containing protein n=1 Tax=Luteococcus japonicus LSP_Lj1 TaxID=1255658 RepID=A0A1R4ICH6_9ACTN|nr:alpha/beta hydrolase [Luteococcus japonicus]SJN17439.1 hypothetical protein FM114_00980 [Luteococcus japonicus LSP_Lj1]